MQEIITAENPRVTHPQGRGLHRLHFRFLTGDVDYKAYGGKFISKRLHNGDWHYWFVISVCRMDADDSYYVTLEVVSPEAAEFELKAAWDSMGMDGEWVKSPVELVEILTEYGTGACIGHYESFNFAEAMMLAKDEANAAKTLLGFYMDRPLNVFGASGWDFVAGNPWGAMRSNADKGIPLEESAKADPKYLPLWKQLKKLKNRTARIQKRSY